MSFVPWRFSDTVRVAVLTLNTGGSFLISSTLGVVAAAYLVSP